MCQAGWSSNRYTAMVRTKGPALGQGPQGWSGQGWGRRPQGCAEARIPPVPAENKIRLGEGEVARTRGEDLIVLLSCTFFPSQP